MITSGKVKLNKEQKEAVEHENGPLLVIAGAGTGKTTVVTERVKYLISKGLSNPSEILALTFTDKAAREMEDRVDRAMPYGYTQMWISTFHSFCDRVLRDEALQIGFDPKYKLMNQAETVQYLRDNLFEFDLNYFRPLGNPTKFLGGILQHFSRLQDEDITPSEYIEWAEKQQKTAKGEDEVLESEKWFELANSYRKYEELKTRQGYMDFGDLIVKTLKLFRERPNILKNYQNKFKFILVDEFQDTNYAQNKLATILADKHKNITVTGDDDQSIYRFRGAAVSNILQFRQLFPQAKIVTLTKNYRSAQEILDRSYMLIQNNNPDRLEVKENVDKKLIAQKNINAEIGFFHSDRVENEAETVAQKIREISKDYEFGDIAILVRANNHAEPFIRALSRNSIPYQFLGPGKLFRQSEIIDLISFLKVLYNFDDSISFYRLLSLDYFEIPARDLIKLSNYSKKYNLSLFEAAEKIENTYISDDAKQKVSRVVNIIKKHFEKVKNETAGQLLYNFLEETGLLQKLLNPDTAQAEKKASNISRFFDKLKSYEVGHEDANVTAVVDWIDLSMELGESPLSADSDWSEVNAVNILTTHSAKGLEFPVVFLVNLVDHRFPSIERREQLPIPENLIKEVLPEGDYHLQEERRLFYVGMTRAKEKLFLTAANFYGEAKREKKLSPFIFEALGEDVQALENKDKSEQLSFLDYAPNEDVALSEELYKHHVDYLSYSQISSFKICPLHYKLGYILGIPVPASSSLSFGTSIHETLKDYYLELKSGKQSNYKRAIELLELNWVKEGYDTKSHQEKMKEKGKVYLQEYLTRADNNIPEILEWPFTIPLEKNGQKLMIGGKIDRVDVLGDGRIEIIDYKTGPNVPTQRDVDKDMQLTFYALAATRVGEEPFGKNPDDIVLSLYYFDTQQKLSTTRTREQLDKAVEEIFEWKKKIEESNFRCSGHFFCQSCEYKLMCSVE